MSCDSTHKCLCKWWIRTKRPSASQEMSSSSRREVTQRTNHSRYCNYLALCIFIALHSYLKSLKTYLRMLNIFDLLLSIMQTDDYVYFFLPIDMYTVFLMNTTDSIKDKSVLTRRLCNCSLVCNLSLWYLYSLSYLEWHSWLVVRQTRINTEKTNVWIHLLFLLFIYVSLSLFLFLFFSHTN